MNFRKLKFILGFLYFILFFVIGKNVEALTISPSLAKMEFNPGEEKRQIVTLFNETNQTLVFYSSAENFTTDQASNVPIFLGDKDILGAARWITVSNSKIELKSGEKKEVIVDIIVPSTAEPGGHYAALFWSSTPPQEGGVKTTNRLAILFLLTVKGNVKEDLQVISFKKIKDVNLNFDLEVENKGNVHLEPFGQLQIFDNNNKQVAIIPINSLKQLILPQSRRIFNLNLKNEIGWGKYSAQAQLYFGQNKIVESKKIFFWLWPQNLFFNFLSVLVILLVVFVIFKLAKKKTSI